MVRSLCHVVFVRQHSGEELVKYCIATGRRVKIHVIKVKFTCEQLSAATKREFQFFQHKKSFG